MCMEPIRILHVFGGLDSGGAESRTMDIYRNINKNKVQFDFLIHTSKKGFFEDEILKMGGKIHRVPQFNLKSIFSYPRAIKKFFRSHPEYKVVHGHMLSTAFIYLSIAKNQSVPIRIAHSRSGSRAQKNIINKVKNLTDKLSRFYATHKFAVSKIAGYGAFGKKRVDSKEVKVIPNAIDSKKYIFSESIRNRLREEKSLSNDFVMGHIGRFAPQKNHLFLLEVFAEVQKKIRNSRLVLVGDGSMRSQILDKITALGLEESVTLLGVRNDVKDLLQAMDVLVFPSTHEGLPGVVLEAQASGLPSVISNAITKEVNITDLVEYESLDEGAKHWASTIVNIAMTTRRKNMHGEFVESGYDIVKVSKQYQSFYLDCIKNI